VEDFLSDIDKFSCKQQLKGNIPIDQEEDKECARSLARDVFQPLGKYGMKQSQLFHHLKKRIFQPLGYRMKNSVAISTLLARLLTLENVSETFKKQPNVINYKIFE
jgi:uncharacterized protein YfaA (DUF2138 family)